jgi:hypothetical protein
MRNPVNHLLAVVALLPFSPGCNVAASVPFEATSPPTPLDLDAKRLELEHEVCESAGADCDVLVALDATDGAGPEVAAAPALPLVMPRSVFVNQLGQDVDVPSWLHDQCETHDLVPQLDVDLGALLENVDPELRDRTVRIEDARVAFDDDELAIDMPMLDVLVGTEEGGMEKVGVVDPHAGGSGDASALWFVEGGTARLMNAITAGEQLALRPSPDDDLVLHLHGDQIVRPGGAASIRLEAALAIDMQVKIRASIE